MTVALDWTWNGAAWAELQRLPAVQALLQEIAAATDASQQHAMCGVLADMVEEVGGDRYAAQIRKGLVYRSEPGCNGLWFREELYPGGNDLFAMFPPPVQEPEATEPAASRRQIEIAQTIARWYGHQWGYTLLPEQRRYTMDGIGRATELTTTAGPMGFGVTCPSLDGDDVVCNTGTGRTSWRIRPDETVQCTVSRPAGDVIVVEFDADHGFHVERLNPHVPIYDRHVLAAHRFVAGLTRGEWLSLDELASLLGEVLPDVDSAVPGSDFWYRAANYPASGYVVRDGYRELLRVSGEEQAARMVMGLRRGVSLGDILRKARLAARQDELEQIEETLRS